MESTAVKHAQAITALFSAFGNEDMKRMRTYCLMLKEMPDDVLDIVVRKAIMTNKFLPTIAELAEHCRSLMTTVNGTKEVPDWGEAWAEIDKAMLRTPWGKSPTFSHPAIADAVNQYGWHNLHTCMADDMPTIRAQIRRMYDEAASRYIEKQRNTQILGEDNPMLNRGSRYRALNHF